MHSIGLSNSPHSSKATNLVRRYQPNSRHVGPFREGVPEGRDGGDESHNTTEAELLSKAQGGDKDAFVELCNLHSHCLKGRIFRIVKNPEDADDIFQETLMRAYKHLNGFRGSSSFQTWITRIAINTALMLLRRRKTSSERSRGLVGAEGEIPDFLEVADPGLNPEQIYSKVQTSVIVSNEVSRLPAGFRPLLDLYYGEENSLNDAAYALGMTLATAKSRLVRARALLRRRLRHHPLMCI